MLTPFMESSVSPSPPGGASPDAVLDHLDRAVRASPADFTEIAWLDERHGKVASRDLKARRMPPRTTTLIRVREGDRSGAFRQASAQPADLERGIREALAHARSADPEPGWRAPEPGTPPTLAADDLFDPALAELFEPGAGDDGPGALLQEHLRETGGDGVSATLDWAEGRAAIATSADLRRLARITAATLHVHAGGLARASARTLRRLDAQAVVDRARDASAADGPESSGEPGPDDGEGLPLVLAPEAACRWLGALNPSLFSAGAHLDGSAPACARQGHDLGSAALTLVDDATRAAGMPFPFDFHGSGKAPLELIRRGIFLGPAVDGSLAQELERAPTAHFLGGDQTHPSHLFAEPSEAESSLDALLRDAEGGLWIGDLDGVLLGGDEPMVSARAKEVRRIRQGRLGQALPDRLLQGSLESLLRRLAAVGGPAVCLALDGIWGGVTSPSWRLEPR